MKKAILALILVLTTVGAFAEGQISEENKDQRIFVQAFVVEVPLQALYDQGVDPLGQGNNSVTVPKIVNCLKQKQAQIIMSKTIAASNKREADISRTDYVTNTSGTERTGRSISHKDITTRFLCNAFGGDSGRLVLEYIFSAPMYRTDQDKTNLEEEPFRAKYEGAITVDPGVAAIAAGSQNKDTAWFMIMVANVR